ncbi:MAG: GTPase HflX [Deltaproteobacteria bacterium]|nr:GTPase HflX [Deltaproteobacteria bacterium]
MNKLLYNAVARKEINTTGFALTKPSLKKERVVLTGIRRDGQSRSDFESSLQELKRLVGTAGGEVIAETSQEVDCPNPKTFIGKGKVEEISEQVRFLNADSVALDDELSPTQNQNLEQAFGVKVLDRTAVILDIFAKRAHTKEGRLQVELAQLKYMAPRLKGLWSHFSKQSGGIGTKGPGETQLEVDRRRVRERIALLKSRLKDVETHRTIHRLKREAVPLPLFSLVGYTNAGKSTLFNALTRAGVLVEDKLFATLDPTVRKIRLPSGRIVLLADTVGFIRKLPHTLVEAFKATFEEVAHSDALIHVVDMSDPEALQQMQTVEQVLLELDLTSKPGITLFNKKDQGFSGFNNGSGIPISALTGEGLPHMLDAMDNLLRQRAQRANFFLPHTRGDILASLYTMGHVLQISHDGEGTFVECEIESKFIQKYQNFLVTA